MKRTFFVTMILFAVSGLMATVHHAGPGQTYSTVSEALIAAENGDDIYIHGTITETDIIVNNDVTIYGEPDGSSIVQGHETDAALAPGRVFFISSGRVVTIRDLTIRHGNGPGGGGVWNEAHLTMETVNVCWNQASDGTPGTPGTPGTDGNHGSNGSNGADGDSGMPADYWDDAEDGEDGGNGGNGGHGQDGGDGGAGGNGADGHNGGGIYNAGLLYLDNCSLAYNRAGDGGAGGDGGDGGNGGNGGHGGDAGNGGHGGAANYNHPAGDGGDGGNPGYGGNGGNGGRPGNGGFGGNGGVGGGLFNSGSVNLTNTSVIGNASGNGGPGGSGGIAGYGGNGGNGGDGGEGGVGGTEYDQDGYYQPGGSEGAGTAGADAGDAGDGAPQYYYTQFGQGGDGGNPGNSGGIHNEGTIDLNNCTIAWNTTSDYAVAGVAGVASVAGTAGVGGDGGYWGDGTPMNDGSDGSVGIDGYQGMMYDGDDGSNSDVKGGGISNVTGASLEVKNTIIGYNDIPGSGWWYPDGNIFSEEDHDGDITSHGYNLLEQGLFWFFDEYGDITDVDIMIDSPQWNGHFTYSCAPLDGSPALENGSDRDSFNNRVIVDQRGWGRIYNTLDIGAYEAGGHDPDDPNPVIYATLDYEIANRARQGEQNVNIARYRIAVMPDQIANLTDFVLDLSQSTDPGDFFNLRLYHGTGSNNINDATVVGTIPDPAVENAFSLDLDLSSDVHYFWTVCDVASDATVGNQIDVVFSHIVASGQTTIPVESDQYGYIKITGMEVTRGNSFYFNGGNTFVQLGWWNALLDHSGPCSVEFWIKPDDSNGWAEQYIFTTNDDYEYSNEMAIVYNRYDQRIGFVRQAGSSPRSSWVSPNGSVPPHQWSHVAIVDLGDGQQPDIYINGSAASLNQQSPDFDVTHGPVWIGSQHDYHHEFCGNLDEFVFWETAIPHSQIIERMHVAPEPPEPHPDMIFYLQFNSEDGSNAIDSATGSDYYIYNAQDNYWQSSGITWGTGGNQTITWQPGAGDTYPPGLGIDFENIGVTEAVYTVVNHLEHAPTGVPDEGDVFLDNQYWIIDKYTDADLIADVTFHHVTAFPDEYTNPNHIRLYRRESPQSHGQWEFVSHADWIDQSTGSARFNGIEASGQFCLALVGAPVLEASLPAQNQTDASLHTWLTLDFDKPVSMSETAAGTIERVSDGQTVATIDFSGGVTREQSVYLPLDTRLAPETEYRVLIPAGAITTQGLTQAWDGLSPSDDYRFTTAPRWTDDTVLHFDESTRVVIPDTPVTDPGGSFTLALWIRHDPVTGNTRIIEKGNIVFLEWDYDYESYPGGGYQCNLNGTSTGWWEFGDGHDFGEWHHIALSWDDATGQVTAWADGQIMRQETVGGTLNLNDDDFILSRVHGFRGDIDRLLWFDRPLTTEEVRQAMHGFSAESALREAWEFGNGSDTLVTGLVNRTGLEIENGTLWQIAIPQGEATSEVIDITSLDTGWLSSDSTGVAVEALPDGPDRQLLCFRLNRAPDDLPFNPVEERSWVVYATEEGDYNAIRFTLSQMDPAFMVDPSRFELWRKAGWDDSWSQIATGVAADAGEGWVEFFQTPVTGHFAVTFAAQSQDPSRGTALEFDGVDDYITLGNDPSLKPDHITLSLWAYMDDWTMAGTQNLINCTQGGGYNIQVFSNLAFNCRIDYAYRAATWPSSSLTPGWHHLAGTYDGDVMRLYVDGAQVATYDFPYTSNTQIQYHATNSVLLGAEAGGGDTGDGGWMDGKIDEVMIFSEALSVSEIRQLLHSSRTPDNPHIVSHYRFNEGSGLVATDAVGGNPGILRDMDAASVWIDSSAPVGPDDTVVQDFLDGEAWPVEFAGTHLEALIWELNGDQTWVVSRINEVPNQLPAVRVNQEYTDRWWVLNAIGGSGFETDLVFWIEDGVTGADEENPDNFTLWHRPLLDDGAWAQLTTADEADAYSNIVTFYSITQDGQFMVTRGSYDQPAATPGSMVRFDDGADATQTSLIPYQPDAITIEGWVRHDSLLANVQRYMTLGSEACVIRHDGASSVGQLHFYISVDGGLHHIRANGMLQSGHRTHVAGVWDGETMKLYCDGDLVGTNLVSGQLRDFHVVKLSNAGEPMIGTMDQFRVWTRALSQDEIRLNMHSVPTRGDEGLLWLWEFNEGAGTETREFFTGASATVADTTGWETSDFAFGEGAAALQTIPATNSDLVEIGETGLGITLSVGITDGTVLAARIDTLPVNMPDSADVMDTRYFTVDLYNGNPPQLDSLALTLDQDIPVQYESSPEAFMLWHRDASTLDWQQTGAAVSVDAATNRVVFTGVIPGGQYIAGWNEVSVDPPQNVEIVATESEITLSWDEVPGAASYRIYAASGPDGPWDEVTGSGSFGTPVVRRQSRTAGRTRVSWTTAPLAEHILFYRVTSDTVRNANRTTSRGVSADPDRGRP